MERKMKKGLFIILVLCCCLNTYGQKHGGVMKNIVHDIDLKSDSAKIVRQGSLTFVPMTVVFGRHDWPKTVYIPVIETIKSDTDACFNGELYVSSDGTLKRKF
jgi:hypothetical protein